jgi:putative MATE family efflux protein
MPTVTPEPAVPAPFLAREDVRRILVLAIPAMLAFLTQTGVNIVDTVFFGLLPEPDRSDGQSVLSNSLILLWAVGGFFSAISVGTQAMVARRTGAGDPLAAGAVLKNAVVLASVASLVASVVGYFFIGHAFAVLMPDNPNSALLGTEYTQWRFLGVVSMVATAAYKAYFDGTGRTYIHFVAAIVMNVVNIVLCWLLIFGHYGAPRMGVEGAGVAGMASSWVGFLVVALFSFSKSDRVERAPYTGRLSASTMKELARISIPSGIATAVIMSGFLLFRRIVEGLDSAHLAAGGTESIYGAATTIIIQVLSITFFSCMAFGVATATLVSQEMGAGRPERAERIAWSSVKLGAMAFGTVGLLEIAFPSQVIRVFNQSPGVIGAATPSLQLMGACGPVIATGMILTQALFGAGNTRYVMIVELLLHLGWLVPGAYFLGVVLELGLIGVWSSAAVYVGLLTAAMVYKFRQGTWKSIKI